MAKGDTYRLAFEIHDEKANIRVYEPIISKEENERRLQEIKDAFHDFWVDYYRRKAIKEREAAKGAVNERVGQ